MGRRKRLYQSIRSAKLWIVFAGVLLWLAGCSGQQSALDPAGSGAERIANLFWWMVAGAAIIWILVVGLAVYSIRSRSEPHSRNAGKWLIIGGGVVFPIVVLTALLAFGLAMLPELTSPAPPGSLKIAVAGEQWWWRVRYLPAGGEAVELANEIRLPVGEPVEFQLESADVIHSFWIPSLGGKIDMIPGRVTRLFLKPTRTGVFRGACAEYCGTSHARMNFPVVVMERDEFARWLTQQAQAAQPPATSLAVRGRELFFANGCTACHTIRGTPANGMIAPDLTHVGSRLSIAAGTLPNEPDAFRRWIAHTGAVKPDVNMPDFGMLSPEELQALAIYLDGLE